MITVLVILLMGVSCAMGYALGGAKIINKVNGTPKAKNQSLEQKEEELDVHSRLVQHLYYGVTHDVLVPSCTGLWEYVAGGDESLRTTFNAETAPEAAKMQIVGMHLNNDMGTIIENSQVPDQPNVSGPGANASSYLGRYLTKDYVEYIYKSIFGQNATLDTSIPIELSAYRVNAYIFDEATQRYYLYYRNSGGTCGNVGSTYVLQKATHVGNTIKIYQYGEDLETDNQGQPSSVTAKYYYVYTFEKESDGMYRFVSRTKEDI